MSISREIALVLDSEYGDKIINLAKTQAVWTISSPTNDAVVLKARETHPGRITVLRKRVGEDQAHTFLRAVDNIDEHHGEVSQYPPYKSLAVYGFSIDLAPIDVIKELGFTAFEKTEFGFRATK